MENTSIVKEGFAYDLHCKLDYSKELSSNIQWLYNDKVVSSSENYIIDEVFVENDGDLLECKYNDAIDSDSIKFSLDVHC